MEPRFLAYLELRQDFLFEKIPKDKIGYYLDSSLRIGQDKARSIVSRDITALLKDAKIKIEHNEGSGEFFKVKLRAQFEFDPKGNNKIILYHESIKEFAEDSGLDFETAVNLHLVHEYFHYLENKEIKTVPESLDPVINFKFFKFKKYAHIKRCSEIAAHAFVKEFLNLDTLPNHYDFEYLIQNKKMSSKDLKLLEADYQQYA